MRIKISEKKLLIGFTTLVVGILVLTKNTIIATPVLVSEKGILSSVAALLLIAFAIALFKRTSLRNKN